MSGEIGVRALLTGLALVAAAANAAEWAEIGADTEAGYCGDVDVISVDGDNASVHQHRVDGWLGEG